MGTWNGNNIEHAIIERRFGVGAFISNRGIGNGSDSDVIGIAASGKQTTKFG